MSVEALEMTQVRWHSRGGQGGMTASQLLAEAGFRDGKETTAFSFYGAERRGAPVASFNRVADTPVKLYSQVAHPDVVVVLDDSLIDMQDVTDGLESDGTIVINTTDEDPVDFDGRRIIVDATDIALEFGLKADGSPLVNTPMLGAAAHTEAVNIDTVASVIEETFDEDNARATRRAYELAQEV